MKISFTSVVQPTWLTELANSWANDEHAQSLISRLVLDPNHCKDYSWTQQTLRYHNRLYVGSNGHLRFKIWQELHQSSIGGHSGIKATAQRIALYFFWPILLRDVKKWCAECVICQTSKSEHVPSLGLLQPLPIPQVPWNDISLDFIEGLPISAGKSIILVIVDRLSKYAHFFAMKHPIYAQSLATLFLDEVYKLHGLPSTIVSDRGSIFLSQFWSKLFSLLGSHLARTTAYHPQSDGQTERVNQCLETYLRCMTVVKPHQWSRWLPLAEWWYNTSHHSSIKTSSFQALYGYSPPLHSFPQHPKSGIAEVDSFVQDRSEALAVIKENLSYAQERMKYFADRNRSERQFNIGDMVFLRLQPYRQSSVHLRRNLKLSPCFYGPYTIIDKIGQVAYKLLLPLDSLIHPVFHVSQLKKCVGLDAVPSTVLPPVDKNGILTPTPAAVLDTRTVKRRHRLLQEVLVQWDHSTKAATSWEDAQQFAQRFPDFCP
ncbi:hypothetical protein ACHQM5_015747 [Ranunculus cassubicifolius]